MATDFTRQTDVVAEHEAMFRTARGRNLARCTMSHVQTLCRLMMDDMGASINLVQIQDHVGSLMEPCYIQLTLLKSRAVVGLGIAKIAQEGR